MEERLGKLLAMALKGLHGHLDGRMEPFGGSLSTYLVLRHIDEHPGLSQRELATRMGIEGPTLTHHLDRLAERELVERVRSDADRRVWTAALTAKGRAHLRRTGAVADGVEGELRALFSAAELQTLTDCLHRITDRYGRHTIDDHRRGHAPVRSATGGRR